MQTKSVNKTIDFTLSEEFKTIESLEYFLTDDSILISQLRSSPIHLSVDRLLSKLSCLRTFSTDEECTAFIIAINDVQQDLKNLDEKSYEIVLSIFGNKDFILISRLLNAIEACKDHTIAGTVCELIYNCLKPTNIGKIRQQLISTLIRNNASEKLLHSLKYFPMTRISKEESDLLHVLQVIAKLASKDNKFAVKCRLIGGVKFTHKLLQIHTKNELLLSPLLLIMKFIAKNPSNQVLLGKDGCVSTLVLLLNSVPKNHWMRLKLILENLSFLLKTKSNAIHMVPGNGINKVLSFLDNSEKIEERHQEKVIKSLIMLLSHLSDSKHGRKCLLDAKGDEVLHKFIVGFCHEPKCNYLLGSTLNVFLKCTLKGDLPNIPLKGAIVFNTPIGSSAYKASAGWSESSPISQEQCTLECSGDDDYEDDDTDDDDDDNDDDSKTIDFTAINSSQVSSLNELLKLSPFFSEFEGIETPSITSQEALQRDQKDGVIESYLKMSCCTKSIISFVKVAYPDMVMSEGPENLEPFHERNPDIIRQKVLRTFDRILHTEHYQEKVVYDLDYLLKSDHSSTNTPLRPLSNWDEKRVGKKDSVSSHLHFESRFESGNLRKAIQISKYEYDLILNSDVNSEHHHQWFYFEVSNMEAGIPYILNIINNEKTNSEFNFGMKPVMFSVKEALQGHAAWVRTGYDICYHKNHFTRNPKNYEHTKLPRANGKTYYTVSLTLKFPHSYDVVYLAYHYPYTFTKLQVFLSRIIKEAPLEGILLRNQKLCETLNGNTVPLLTISSEINKKEKDVVLLTSRVHPGESNSSWVIQGIIQYLLGPSNEAQFLRKRFIFKIIPMLNPEGVIHGNQRCGLTNEDLNRRWRNPSQIHHPTIYYAKVLIEYLTVVIRKPPLIFCDFHGHSRQKNIFMYGCSKSQSWRSSDQDLPKEDGFMVFPQLAQMCMKAFSLIDCRFDIEKSKESTARVVVWRQFNVKNSYTIEASTCGCDQGPYKNFHLNPKLLLECGEEFCLTLLQFGSQCNNSFKGLTSKLPHNNLNYPSRSSGTSHYISPNFDHLDTEDDDLDFELFGITQSGAPL